MGLSKGCFILSFLLIITFAGDIGRVENVLIEVTYMEMIVTYTAPLGYETCNLDYEVVFLHNANSTEHQRTVNKNLRQSFNYSYSRALCKLVNLDITPIHNGVRGESYSSNQFTGDIGRVQNVLIKVTDMEMIVSYTAPLGYETCNLDYEVVFWHNANSAEYQRTVNKNLRQSFNYWYSRALCKLVNLDITPIYNGVRGETYSSNQFTDKFDPHIDIGSVRNLTLSLETDVLLIKWVTPTDYDTCPFHFTIETRDSVNSELLELARFQGFEWRYNYGSTNNYCRDVVVVVVPYMRGVAGGEEVALTRLGPPPSGSC